MNPILSQHLESVARRFRFRQICLTLASCWLLAALIGLLMLAANRYSGWYSSTILPSAVLIFVLSTLIGSVLIARSTYRKNDYRVVVEKIENQFPDLDSGLLTAIEQRPEQGSRFGFLQQEVIRKAVYHDINNIWARIVPGWQVVVAPFASAGSLAMVAAVLLALFFMIIPPEPNPNVTTFDDAVFSGTALNFEIEPGNIEIEKGNSLLVLARFDGRTPPGATLKYADVSGNAHQIQMTKSLDDPVFAARIPEIQTAHDYFVQLENQRSHVFRISVFEFPKLKRADAKLEFPEYTGQQSKVVQDFRSISAVEGTRLTLSLMLNKSVDKAILIARDGAEVELKKSADDPTRYEAEWTLEKTQRLELQLVDSAHRTNQVPPRFRINVLPNLPPTIKIKTPAKDIQVSPLEEVILSTDVWDDFGILRAGMVYMMPGRESVEQTFAEDVAAGGVFAIQHLLEFEKLNAKPDQLLSYYFWAEDIGPNGQPRRVSGDMYFAEVRPFEEIFRQGQQPTASQQQQQQQQGQQNAQQAGKLADLQKQIINATWKMIRREGVRDSVSATFADDGKLLVESQKSALEQVRALAQQLTDPKSSAVVEEVLVDMSRSVELLEQATEEGDPSILKPALVSEQASYQGLLRLRAREHEVVRNNQRQQQQQGGQSNGPSQQQMQQLQLENDENRYESQKLAEDQQDSEEREDRQILNRLRELSRRQNDMNKRVKELQSALQAAADEQEKKEIEKQLKRLQEEQQQILRDTEELRERMDQPQNRQRMGEPSQQLEQARENIRRANEALEKGQVSRAAAEGTKAERELDEIKEEFKNRTSGQFTERMRQMRERAEEVDQQQDEIAKDISELNRPKQGENPKSLRPKDDRLELKDKIEKQKDDVQKLKQSIRDTIEQAEDVEPLLAEELYETYRRTRQQDPVKSLESTQRSLKQGWNQDAEQQEQQANQGIKEIRKGIEKAAERVLGDETQSLRRADRQLNRLKDELKDEISRNDPDAMNEDRQSNPSRQQDQRSKSGGKNQPDKNGQKAKGDSDRGSDKTEGKTGDSKDGKPDERKGKQEGKRGGGKSSDGKPNDSPPDPQDRAQGGNPGQGRSKGNADQTNNRPPQPPRSLRDQDRNPNSNRTGGAPPRLNDWGGDDRNIAPLTGDNFLDWSDRLRDVEEMVDDPKLRADAARIRDRARAIRKQFQRHSKEPNWELVRLKVFEPLEQLQRQIQDELIRKTNRKSIVPIDRDPVPAQFQDAVRRYYQEIGSGK